MNRDELHQQEPIPGRDYSGFPARLVSKGSKWHRVHHKEREPWYFSSHMGGRFDLPSPDGTCYAATSKEAAARELIGPDFISSKKVNSQFVQDRSISSVQLPWKAVLAKLTDQGAFAYGVSNELSCAGPYQIGQAWAAVLYAEGFNGIWYRPRFSTGDDRAVALFDTEGLHDYVFGETEPLQGTVESILGMKILETQNLDQYEIVDSPIP